jgi:hypothetical protein
MLQRRLRAAFGLTLVILGVEVAGGVVSHSLALLSDAGHVVTDFFALGLAWFAAAQANRPADIRKTYGYHRVGIIAALANAVTLLLIVVGIGVEAAQRFWHPEPTTPLVMIAAAAVGHHPEPGDRPRATSGRRCSRGLCWRGSRSASQRRPVHDGRPGRTPRSCAAPRSGCSG